MRVVESMVYIRLYKLIHTWVQHIQTTINYGLWGGECSLNGIGHGIILTIYQKYFILLTGIGKSQF